MGRLRRKRDGAGSLIAALRRNEEKKIDSESRKVVVKTVCDCGRVLQPGTDRCAGCIELEKVKTARSLFLKKGSNISNIEPDSGDTSISKTPQRSLKPPDIEL